MRFGETMKAAAIREAREETGLDVEIGEVVWVGEIIDETVHLALVDFEATVAGGELRAGDDAADARWVELSDLHQYQLTPTMYQMIDTLAL